MSWRCVTALFCFFAVASCRNHSLTLKNDQRPDIDITAFGMYVGGFIDISMSVELDTLNPPEEVVLAVYRQTTAMSRNLFSAVTHEDVCNVSNHKNNDTLCFHSPTSVSSSCLNVTVGRGVRGLLAVNPSHPAGANLSACPASPADGAAINSSAATKDQANDLSFLMLPSNGSWQKFDASFNVSVSNDTVAGLYKVYIKRNCLITSEATCSSKMNLKISLLERNIGTYLSAGEIPLPYVYFAMAGLFFASGCGYWYIICHSKEGLFKLHYMILAALYCKGLALVFHGVNYYYIGLQGHRETAWAVIYYITYLMRTVVLFLTILLVGTGWSFIKHVFSGKEKKLLLIALPLQVLAYVARVIMEETEEGDQNYLNWQRLAIAVDILCFAAILFPVIWSIRHLTEASETDGKAARNLAKLKIFRQYYILVIAYIYIQEIIINIMELAEPFQYEWLSTLTREVTTFLFVIITAFKFRPATDNPYFRVPEDDDEEEVLTKSALLETVTRVVKIEEEDEIDTRKSVRGGGGTGTAGPKQREASHEFD